MDLTIWTIFDHPKDYPEYFIARKFVGEWPTQELFGSRNIEELRRVMVNRGLTRLDRHPDDDPVIVETWL
jgi:hypothetical protein